MVFKNEVKNVQAAAYNGACTVYDANEDIQNQEFESQNESSNLRNWRIGILVVEKQMAIVLYFKVF